MANFHFDLVSPEKLLFAGEVGQVDLPGAEGDLGVERGQRVAHRVLRVPARHDRVAHGLARRLGRGGDVAGEGLLAVVLQEVPAGRHEPDPLHFATHRPPAPCYPL